MFFIWAFIIFLLFISFKSHIINFPSNEYDIIFEYSISIILFAELLWPFKKYNSFISFKLDISNIFIVLSFEHDIKFPFFNYNILFIESECAFIVFHKK